MQIVKLLALENNGLNMAVDEEFFYARCKKNMLKYKLSDMSLITQNTIFKKDGKARNFIVHKDYIFLKDFCDFYILRKDNLEVVEALRIGTDSSSDICGNIGSDAQNVYINQRGGFISKIDIATKAIDKIQIGNASFWNMSVTDKNIYLGAVDGKLVELNKADMSVSKEKSLGKGNIYSVILDDDILYTVSSNGTLQAISVANFETVRIVKKVLYNQIFGVYGNHLVTWNRTNNGVMFWDKFTLTECGSYDFPLDSPHNINVIMANDTLFISDMTGVYTMDLNEHMRGE